MNESPSFRKIAHRAVLATAIVAMAADFRPVFAATPGQVHVGRAKLVVEDVRAQYRKEPAKAVTVNAPLYFEERILTTGDSRSVVEFRDGSILQVGPNAIVILDRFVFNPFESKSEKVITAVSGAFRYISGMKTKTSSLQIRTASATIGIRGSLTDFLVLPNVPVFVSVGDGIATVSNDRGSVDVNPGQSIAVPTRDTPIPPPNQLPPAVAVQALQHINNQVGAPPAPDSLTPVTAAEAQADAAANALPTDQQLAGQTAPAAGPVDAAPPPAGAIAGPPPGVGLLVAAAQVGLLEARGNVPLTAAQQNFVSQANAAIPNAAEQLQSSAGAAKQQTRANGNRSIQTIVKAAVQLAPGQSGVAQLVTAAAEADAVAAALIAATAVEGAPEQAVVIAGAAAKGAPSQAAAIAGGLAKAQPALAAAISVVITNVNKAAAGDIVAAVAQNVPPAQAAEALSAVSNIVPEQATELIASVAAISPEAATQALSDIATAAGGQDTGGTDTGAGDTGTSDDSGDGGSDNSESQINNQPETTS